MKGGEEARRRLGPRAPTRARRGRGSTAPHRSGRLGQGRLGFSEENGRESDPDQFSLDCAPSAEPRGLRRRASSLPLLLSLSRFGSRSLHPPGSSPAEEITTAFASQPAANDRKAPACRVRPGGRGGALSNTHAARRPGRPRRFALVPLAGEGTRGSGVGLGGARRKSGHRARSGGWGSRGFTAQEDGGRRGGDQWQQRCSATAGTGYAISQTYGAV